MLAPKRHRSLGSPQFGTQGSNQIGKEMPSPASRPHPAAIATLLEQERQLAGRETHKANPPVCPAAELEPQNQSVREGVSRGRTYRSRPIQVPNRITEPRDLRHSQNNRSEGPNARKRNEKPNRPSARRRTRAAFDFEWECVEK